MTNGSFESVVGKIAGHVGKTDFLFEQTLDLELVNRVFRSRTFKSLELLKDAEINMIDDQYLTGVEPNPGVLLIRSPKNTGKTASLKTLLNDNNKSVLFVGHRITLLRQASKMFGLTMYSDTDVDGPRYAVTLDSLWRANRRRIYDYVIVDESEQVLNHLFSDPMLGRQNISLQALKFHLERARHVVALDADLDWATLNFFGSFIDPNSGRTLRLIINQYKNTTPRTLRIHSKQRGVDDEIIDAARALERIFVVSDDRGYIDRTYKRLTGDGKLLAAKVLKVTSETSQQPEVRKFLEDPRQHSRGYHAVLASPSISSGLDVSFDDQEIVFKRVFGVFLGHHFTHLECDQQLSRVRDPGKVVFFIQSTKSSKYRVPISQDESFFDLEPQGNVASVKDAIERRVVKAVKNVTLTGYAVDGTEIRTPGHQLEQIAQDLVPPRMFSREHLKANFVSHMKEQGWVIEAVTSSTETEPQMSVSPEALRKRVIEISNNDALEIDLSSNIDTQARLVTMLLKKAALLDAGIWREKVFSKYDLVDFANECSSRRGEIKSALGFTIRSDVFELPVMAIGSILTRIGITKTQKATTIDHKSVITYKLET